MYSRCRVRYSSVHILDSHRSMPVERMEAAHHVYLSETAGGTWALETKQQLQSGGKRNCEINKRREKMPTETMLEYLKNSFK